MDRKNLHRIKGLKNHLFLTGTILWSVFSHGQSLEILDDQSNVINGDTIFVEIDVNDISVDVYAGLANVGNSAIDVNVTRYEVNVLPSTSSYFCWGSCTGVTASGDQPVVTPSGSVNFSVGETVPCNANGFTLHYDPNFQLGTSLFRIKFFDIANQMDSSDVYISITSVDQLGVDEVSNKLLQIYPNPAENSFWVSAVKGVDYQLYSSMGNLVKEGKAEPMHQINVSQLPSGTYFVQINIEGEEIREMIVIQ